MLLRSARRVFCAGANIRMLAAATHAFKVNFCKFTNETRNAIEDASEHRGLPRSAALNGTAAGGGYELALACDKIMLVDDGGCGRVAARGAAARACFPAPAGSRGDGQAQGAARPCRCVLHDGGRRAGQARAWNGVSSTRWCREQVRGGGRRRAQELAAQIEAAEERQGNRADAAGARGLAGWRPPTATVSVDRIADGSRPSRCAGPKPGRRHEPTQWTRGRRTWSLQAFRELEDALLHLRFNELEIGVIVSQDEGRSRQESLAARSVAREPTRPIGSSRRCSTDGSACLSGSISHREHFLR